jgi:hypothetical protein
MRYNTLYPPKSQWGSNGGQRQNQKKKTSVKSEVFVVRETGLESAFYEKFRLIITSKTTDSTNVFVILDNSSKS